MKQVKFRMPQRMLALVCGLILTVGAFAQQITVKGHVKDATGEPVIGATVRVVGSDGGVVTDFDGNFTIQAKQGAELNISFIGYEPQNVAAAPNVVVTLRDDSQSLNEVVVIGYGVARKSDLTGSVTALKPDTKNKGLVVSAQDMLGGKVAGMSVVNDGGTPGGGATIRIRGGSSLKASNDPLIVIDGVPVDNTGIKGAPNMLATINPQDIESFNVLKDASATAIYGSRGSNGVIIITTKKGRKGQAPQVSYNGSVTLSMKKNQLDVLDGNQYREFIKEIWGEGTDAYDALGTANTDWQDLIYRTAFSHDHNVQVAGSVGTVLPYRVSLGYTGQQGILKTSDYSRYTLALNLNPSFFDDHLVLNLNGKGMYARSQYANTGAIGAAFAMDPTQDPYSYTSQYHMNKFAGYDALYGYETGATLRTMGEKFNGYFEWPSDGGYDSSWPYARNSQATANPLALLDGRHDVAHSRSFIGSADIDYKIHGFEDLRLHATLGADISTGRQVRVVQPWSPESMYYGYRENSSQLKRNLSLSTTAQYYHDFNDRLKNHVDVMVGYEWQHFWHRDKWNGYGTYPMTTDDETLRGTEYRTSPATNTPTENFLVSYFGRANYIMLDRYYLTATVRRDGSSRFKNHWSTFPAFAFAWRVKDEAFLSSANWLSDLKLRLGWGKTGQQDIREEYVWIPTYEHSDNTTGFYPVVDVNGDGVITPEEGCLTRPRNYTPELKWETTTTVNVALDWGILNQRVSGTIEWYHRKTTDLLNYAPVKYPMTAYRNKANQNIGSLENTGVEFAISYKAIQTKDWYWTIDYNFTYNHNEITDLNGVTEDPYGVPNSDIKIGTDKYLQYNQAGHPFNSFVVYQQVYDQNGKPLEGVVVDRNGNGTIDQGDRYFYKSPAAPVTMGLGTRLEYKNWDFGMNFRASLGNYVFNNIESGNANIAPNYVCTTTNGLVLNNRPVSVLDAGWQTYDETALLSDRYVHNASFLKCDNITLGYSFENLLKTGNYHGLAGRVYATATNVFTITKYKGLDPEIFSGYDNSMYPRPFSVIVGLSLNF